MVGSRKKARRVAKVKAVEIKKSFRKLGVQSDDDDDFEDMSDSSESVHDDEWDFNYRCLQQIKVIVR